MIDPQSRSLEWIEQASGLIPNIADTALVEKAIRALSLQESLVRSGCPFVFKGGTALMLQAFYRNLVRGKNKREAFSAAKNEVRKKYAEPRYWAAFIMLD